MKKSVMCGLAMSVSMFSIGAYATDASSSAVTTKGYVDAGLKYVYDAAKSDAATLRTAIGNVADPANEIPASGLRGDVASLQAAVGNANSGLTQAVATNTSNISTLQNSVQTMQTNTKTYTAGDGVAVTQVGSTNEYSVGVALPAGAANGAKYVFQSDGQGGGSWTVLEVEDSWSDGAFETFMNNN